MNTQDTVRIERSRDDTCGSVDDLVTRLYRAALSIKDAGWQGLLKNAAFSLSAAQRPSALVAAIALIDTVLVLAEHGHHLDSALTLALRTNLRAALSGPPASAARAVESGVSASAR